MIVTIVGDPHGATGYSAHCRGLIKGLLENDVDVRVECARPNLWERNPNLDDDLIETIQKPVVPRAVTIAVSQPPFWLSKLSDRPEFFVGCLVFEGDRIPKGWAKICNDARVDRIVVPSNHVLTAAINSGVNKNKLAIIPHGVDLKTFKPNVGLNEDFKRLKDESVCTFLFNKGWVDGVNDRSGFDLIAKAFREEFKKGERVRLLAHVNEAYSRRGWNFGDELKKLDLVDGCDIVHLPGSYPHRVLAQLYACVDCLVFANKAEGFNLSVLEGMACGVPSVYHKYGGEADFGIGLVVESDKTIPASGGVLYEGVNWVLPSVSSLRAQLRAFFDAWKNNGLGSIKRDCRLGAERFSWGSVAGSYLRACKEKGVIVYGLV